MTLAQIIRQSLLMLGEDPEDVSEFEEMFAVYANIGYQTLMRDYLKPREMRRLFPSPDGIAPIDGEEIIRVVEVYDIASQAPIPFMLMPDGKAIACDAYGREVAALCEIVLPDLKRMSDEPRLTPVYQHALCDYICYKHLSNGNMAKQSRAQTYLRSFYETASKLRPAGFGSVTKLRNLYEATDIRS